MTVRLGKERFQVLKGQRRSETISPKAWRAITRRIVNLSLQCAKLRASRTS